MIYIAPIVEGHGEVEAVPALLHRIFNVIGYNGQVLINPPIRVKVGSFLTDPNYRRRMILLASSKAAERGGTVMILFDCEDRCPAELGPNLLADARAFRADVRILVVLSYREYETWFITAARSLRGKRGLPADLEPPANPEAIRGAKEWLSERMATSYDPIIHQAEFSRTIDIGQARGNPSFDRLCIRLGQLVPPPVA